MYVSLWGECKSTFSKLSTHAAIPDRSTNRNALFCLCKSHSRILFMEMNPACARLRYIQPYYPIMNNSDFLHTSIFARVANFARETLYRCLYDTKFVWSSLNLQEASVVYEQLLNDLRVNRSVRYIVVPVTANRGIDVTDIKLVWSRTKLPKVITKYPICDIQGST